jgi:hypothetical protein
MLLEHCKQKLEGDSKGLANWKTFLVRTAAARNFNIPFAAFLHREESPSTVRLSGLNAATKLQATRPSRAADSYRTFPEVGPQSGDEPYSGPAKYILKLHVMASSDRFDITAVEQV